MDDDSSPHHKLLDGVISGDLKLLENLVNNFPVDLANVKDDHRKKGLLHYAAQYAKADIFKFLLEGGSVDIFDIDLDGKTTLHFACQGGSSDIVNMCLAAGLSPTVEDRYRRTSLHEAATCSFTPGISLLLGNLQPDEALDLCLREDIRGRTALGWAAATGCLSFVTKLMQHYGAHRNPTLDLLNSATKLDCYPLIIAVQSRQLSMLALLIALGADPTNILREEHWRVIKDVQKVSLCGLDLSVISPNMAIFDKLESLDLSDNLLECIPASLSTLFGLKDVVLASNPLTPYRLRLGNSFKWPALREYLGAVLVRAKEWTHRKVVVVNCSASSRPSLYDMLTKAKVRGRGEVQTQDVNLPAPASALAGAKCDGLAVSLWNVPIPQPSSAALANFFFTPNAVYLVAFDPHDERSVHTGTYCVNLIRAMAGNDVATPIFLVATYEDGPLCTDDWMASLADRFAVQFPKYRFRGFRDTHFVAAGRSSEGLLRLKRAVVEVIRELLVVRGVREQWVVCYDYFKVLAERGVMLFYGRECTKHLRKCGVDKAQSSMLLDFLREMGVLIHYDCKPRLCDLFIISPSLIVELVTRAIPSISFRRPASPTVCSRPMGAPTASNGGAGGGSFLTHKQQRSPCSSNSSSPSSPRAARAQTIISPTRTRLSTMANTCNTTSNAFTTLASLRRCFPDYPPHVQEAIVDLLDKGSIVLRINSLGSTQGNNASIISCSLLPDEMDVSELWPDQPPPGVLEQGRIYKFLFLPLNFFFVLLGRLCHMPNMVVHSPWKQGTLVRMFGDRLVGRIVFDNFNHRLEITVRENRHVVLASDAGGKVPKLTMMSDIVQVVEELIDGYFTSIREAVERSVPCVFCFRNLVFHNKRNPHHFSVQECFQAQVEGKSVVYCKGKMEETHAVPISELASDISLTDLDLIDPSHIEVGSEIGSGGFASVMKAQLTGPDNSVRTVVVKQLKLKAGGDFIEKANEFRHEAFIMASLEHPNIVKLLGVTSHPMWLVIEYFPMCDLYHAITSGLDMSWDYRVRVGLDMALGLEYLHRIVPAIVHRDLRSPNIFLVSSDATSKVVAKIGDFGLSRRALPHTAGLLKTWQWAAPEVLDYRNTTYGPPADVYSFGMVLWEVVARNVPFDEYWEDSRFTKGELGDLKSLDLLEIKRAIIHLQLRPTIPPLPAGFEDLGILMAWCWEHDPKNRPHSSEVAQILNYIKAGTSVNIEAMRRKARSKSVVNSRVINQMPLQRASSNGEGDAPEDTAGVGMKKTLRISMPDALSCRRSRFPNIPPPVVTPNGTLSPTGSASPRGPLPLIQLSSCVERANEKSPKTS